MSFINAHWKLNLPNNVSDALLSNRRLIRLIWLLHIIASLRLLSDILSHVFASHSSNNIFYGIPT
jgi:hypothetical protein